jgi:uncharacterized protein (TIGR03435 family)
MRALILLWCWPAIAQQASVWKEFTLTPSAHTRAPLEKTIEWTYPATSSKVVYATCCPWLDVEGSFSRVGTDAWSLRATGVSLKSLMARLTGLPQVRIIAPDWMSRDRYAFLAQVSDEYRLRLRRRDDIETGPAEELRTAIRRELEERLQLRTHRETRMVPVYVLKAGESTKLGQAEAPDGGLQAWARDGMFRVVNGSDAILLTWLQNTVQRPVFGADLPPGAYHFDVKWKSGNTRSLATSLWEQLGLSLIEDTRELEFLVIDGAMKPEWR